ncbi:MAG: hypothetical protein JSS29_12795 [Proteobacteria bacterium]|nr:hypothetical protein [Pseudomonadota bacterium]
MKTTSAEGFPAEPQVVAVAANEEFADGLDDYERVTGARAGWDPYDVWRTRVKTTSISQEREADPRR